MLDVVGDNSSMWISFQSVYKGCRRNFGRKQSFSERFITLFYVFISTCNASFYWKSTELQYQMTKAQILNINNCRSLAGMVCSALELAAEVYVLCAVFLRLLKAYIRTVHRVIPKDALSYRALLL